MKGYIQLLGVRTNQLSDIARYQRAQSFSSHWLILVGEHFPLGPHLIQLTSHP
jgi:hypothetical protein